MGKLYLSKSNILFRKKNNKFIQIKDNSFDFWHTIGVWADMLNEMKENNADFTDYEFKLITNKENNLQFEQSLKRFQNKEISFTEIIEYIQKIELGETNSDARNKFFNIDTTLQKHLLSHLTVITNESEIQSKIMNCICDRYSFKIEDKCDLDKAERLKQAIISNIFEELYETTCNKNFTSKDLTEISNPILYDKKLPARIPSFEDISLVNDNAIFIKQLIDIGDLDKDDDEYVEDKIEIVTQKIKAELYWKDLIEEHYKDIFGIDEYKKSKRRLWKNAFNKYNTCIKEKVKKSEDIEDDFINEQARSVLYDIRNIKDDYGDDISIGTFYSLSDEPRIGWRYDWETKYKMQANG